MSTQAIKDITIVAKEGQGENLNKTLIHMEEESIKEDGCLRYELYRDTSDNNIFKLYEIWETDAHLEAHRNSPHFVNFKKVAPDLIENKSGLTLTRPAG